MKRKHLWGWCVVAASLMASNAGAVEFFVRVPYLGGNFEFRTEFQRQDLNKSDVAFTYVADGKSGLGLPSLNFTVLPGPSTSMQHPLLTDNYGRDFHRPPDRSDPKWYLPGSGLVIMEGEQGLLGIETGVEIGADPTTAWELPMLTADDAFKAGDTAYVLNLMKTGDVKSQLSIFNLSGTPALCSTRLLAPKGWLIEQRTGIAVPSIGGVRLADILSKVAANSSAGMSVAVTCDHPFYPIGSYPAPAIADIRVHFPSPDPPTTGVKQTLVAGASFKVTFDNSVKTWDLPLEVNTRYRSLVIDFDVVAAEPANEVFYRGLIGMWRSEPGQRFGKTLYFGVNERFDRSKLLIDLGTPYIEIMIKKGKATFVKGRTYHFHIEANSDQKLLRQIVTNSDGSVLADMRSGLFNDDLMNRNGNTITVGIGLAGVADGAYSPPFGWKFLNITMNGFK